MSKFGNNPSKIKSRLADHAIILDNFILLPIKKIRKIKKKVRVYDISVKGTHSFIGNGYLLHNTVTEAMWKKKPVIGGPAKGIALQITHGRNGLLAKTPEEAGQYLIHLLENKKLRTRLGQAAHQTVKNKFLMSRLVLDHLKIYNQFIKKGQP